MKEEDARTFQSKAETIASLHHPHIIRVLDFNIERDVPFLVMDYAPFGSLRQRDKSGDPVPLSDVVSYVTSIASGLQYVLTG